MNTQKGTMEAAVDPMKFAKNQAMPRVIIWNKKRINKGNLMNKLAAMNKECIAS